MTKAEWQYGGAGNLFPNLTWSNRPDMTGSEAPHALQDAWVATFMAMQDVLGAVKNGNCVLIGLTAGALVQDVLGEPVSPCAGYAGFVERNGRSEFGMRWRPEKWAKWIDADAGSHVSPAEDIHVWFETRTHIVDFTTGDTMGDNSYLWPPLIYWPKWRMPKHPREACEPGSILLWRHPKALSALAHLASLVTPLAARAFAIYSDPIGQRRAAS